MAKGQPIASMEADCSSILVRLIESANSVEAIAIDPQASTI